MHEHKPLLGIGLMLAAVMCFAALDATSKHLSQTFSVPLLVWARYLFHFLLMLIFLGPRLGLGLVRTRRPVANVFRATMLTGVTGFAMAAFRTMPLAETTALLFVTPLIVALLAGPVLGERVGTARWLAVLGGFGGVLLIARPDGELSTTGVLWTLAAAACYTAYQLQTRQLAATENTWTMLFYTALVGSALMTLALPLFWTGPTPSWSQAALIATLGLYGGTGHYLLIRAFRYARASTLSPFLYAQLVWATLLGWLVYGHLPDHTSLIGIAIIASSSLLMATWEKRHP